VCLPEELLGCPGRVAELAGHGCVDSARVYLRFDMGPAMLPQPRHDMADGAYEFVGVEAAAGGEQP
jgi:hypothetical protein